MKFNNYRYESFTGFTDGVVKHLNDNEVPRENIIKIFKDDYRVTVIYIEYLTSSKIEDWAASKMVKRGDNE